MSARKVSNADKLMNAMAKVLAGMTPEEREDALAAMSVETTKERAETIAGYRAQGLTDTGRPKKDHKPSPPSPFHNPFPYDDLFYCAGDKAHDTFRYLAKICHPDVNPGAIEIYKAIAASYEAVTREVSDHAP